MNKLSILLLADPRCSFNESDVMLRRKGDSVTRISGEEALFFRLRKNKYDALFIPITTCQSDDTLIGRIKNMAALLPVIVLADHEISVDEIVKVMRAGASTCLDTRLSTENFWEELKKVILPQAVPPKHLPNNRRQPDFANIIGESPIMKKVFSLIRKVCDADTTVLVRGESGTGKELIARALHYEGVRRNGPFVPVNCGAIPAELLESELFGHEKGAFTHAIRTRVGRFELADSGTVFLDEISEMSPMLQVKLLRVLQERQFERVGGTRTIKSNFRVIAATNRDLEEEVKTGRFRQDLYYRLNVIPVKAPPLRERASDIPLLVNSFMKRFNHSKKKAIKGIASEVMDRLAHYSWPGNVRELENVVERMVILSSEDHLTVDDLPERLLGPGAARREDAGEIPPQGFCLSDVVTDFEKKLIMQALDQTDWVKNRAAKLLKVNRTTLLEKMKRYEVARSGVGH